MRSIALECEVLGREGKMEELGGKMPGLRLAFDELARAIQEDWSA